MIIVGDLSQVCLDAFSNCERLLNEIDKKNVSSQMYKLLNECAHICMGTFYSIQYGSVNTSRLAILCMGICEECAEACDDFDGDLFKLCAEACRYCSQSMHNLVAGSMN